MKLEKFSSPFFSHEFENEKWRFIADGNDSFVYKNQDRNGIGKNDKVLKIYLKSNLSQKDIEKYYFLCQKFDEFLIQKFEKTGLKIRALYTKKIGTHEFDFGNYGYAILKKINGKSFLDEDIENILIQKFGVSKSVIRKIILDAMHEFFGENSRLFLHDMNIQLFNDQIILSDIGDDIEGFLEKFS